MDTNEIEKTINTRMHTMEETLKQAAELISDAYSQCSLIVYLNLLKKDMENAENSSTAPKI